MTNLLAKQIPTPSEAIFLIAVVIGIIAVLGYTDIILHDFYVKPDIKECFPQNQNQFCTDLRNLHGLPFDAQIDIGNKYWDVLKIQLLAFLVLLFFIKIAIIFGKPGKKGERLKFGGLILFTAIVWGISGGILFYFAGVDFFYYELRPDVPMPDELPWLNEAGALKYLKIFGEDPNMVEKAEVYFAFGLGVGILIGIWLILIYKSRKLNLELRKRRI